MTAAKIAMNNEKGLSIHPALLPWQLPLTPSQRNSSKIMRIRHIRILREVKEIPIISNLHLRLPPEIRLQNPRQNNAIANPEYPRRPNRTRQEVRAPVPRPMVLRQHVQLRNALCVHVEYGLLLVEDQRDRLVDVDEIRLCVADDAGGARVYEGRRPAVLCDLDEVLCAFDVDFHEEREEIFCPVSSVDEGDGMKDC